MTGGQAVLEQLTERSERPTGAHLQVADRCNQACRHCYQVLGRASELGTDGMLEVIDRLADSGILMLNVSGGEPTLRPDLISILQHARARHFAVRLLTNGLRVDEALAVELGRLHLLAVEVSVYSHIAAEHDAVTGLDGSWLRTVHALRQLRSHGVNRTLKWTVTSLCSSKYAEMKALSEGLEARLSMALAISGREDGHLAAAQSLQCSEERMIELLAAQEVDPAGSALAQREERVCGACARAWTVRPDGLVQVCPAIPVVLGDAKAMDLSRTPANGIAAQIASMRWADLPSCRECALLVHCARCHGEAVASAGDLLGPYEGACRMARAVAAARLGLGRLKVVGNNGPLGPYIIRGGGVVEAVPRAATGAHEQKRWLAHPWVWQPAASRAEFHLTPRSRGSAVP